MLVGGLHNQSIVKHVEQKTLKNEHWACNINYCLINGLTTTAKALAGKYCLASQAARLIYGPGLFAFLTVLFAKLSFFSALA
jgi:hypothetical protein